MGQQHSQDEVDILQKSINMFNKDRKIQAKELKNLSKESQFSMKQVKGIFEMFRNSKGEVAEVLTKKDFQAMFHIHDSQMGFELFNRFDTDNTGTIDIKEFILGLAILCNGSKEEKLGFAFDIYDADQSGGITKDEMKDIFACSFDMSKLIAQSILDDKSHEPDYDAFLQKLVESQENQEEPKENSEPKEKSKETKKRRVIAEKNLENFIDIVVDEIFSKADTNKDGVLCRKEFVQYASKNPRIVQFLTPFQRFGKQLS